MHLQRFIRSEVWFSALMLVVQSNGSIFMHSSRWKIVISFNWPVFKQRFIRKLFHTSVQLVSWIYRTVQLIELIRSLSKNLNTFEKSIFLRRWFLLLNRKLSINCSTFRCWILTVILFEHWTKKHFNHWSKRSIELILITILFNATVHWNGTWLNLVPINLKCPKFVLVQSATNVLVRSIYNKVNCHVTIRMKRFAINVTKI